MHNFPIFIYMCMYIINKTSLILLRKKCIKRESTSKIQRNCEQKKSNKIDDDPVVEKRPKRNFKL